jgi:CRP-like cAMP-binding protein
MTVETSKLGAASLLRSNALFGGLSGDALDSLMALGRTRRCRRGEHLFLQGDPGSALHLILSGEVRITANGPEGQELHLNTLGSGEVMGEIALIDGGPRTATATMTRDGLVFCIERGDFVALLDRQPGIMKELLELLCQRVRWTSSLLEDAAFLSNEARLAKRLLAIAGVSGVEVAEGLEIRISQADLASYLNLTRQLVNQLLQRLRKDRVLDIGRGRLVLRNLDELRARSVTSPREAP